MGYDAETIKRRERKNGDFGAVESMECEEQMQFKQPKPRLQSNMQNHLQQYRGVQGEGKERPEFGPRREPFESPSVEAP